MTLVDAAVADSVQDWRDGVRSAALMLVELDAATPTYPQACVEVVESQGPYIVLTPGLALVHARPENGGTALGVAALRLHEPVEFGHADNDPVRLLLAFSSPDGDAHVGALQRLALALQNGLVDRLDRADGPTEMKGVLEEVLRD
jgi:ascorbate PTS system EIIA or EIIAB component